MTTTIDLIEAQPDLSPPGDRAAWLEARRTGIGSSDIANIVCPKLGEPSFGGPWDVLVSKRDGATTDDSPVMLLGRNLEAGIGAAWGETHGLRVVPAKMVRHPQHAWALASPDFWVLSGDAVVGILETKNTRKADEYPAAEPDGHTPVTRDDVPLRYFLQCLWQRWVCEAALGCELRVWLAPLLWGSDLRSYEVPRDPELLQFAAAEAERFWLRHVEGGEPLPVDGSAACWREVAAGAGDEVLEMPGEMADLLDALATVRDREKAAKAEAAKLRARVGEMMRGAKSARGERWRATWSGGGVRRTFDAKAFRAAHPDLAAKFMVERPTAASLRITEAKS